MLLLLLACAAPDPKPALLLDHAGLFQHRSGADDRAGWLRQGGMALSPRLLAGRPGDRVSLLLQSPGSAGLELRAWSERGEESPWMPVERYGGAAGWSVWVVDPGLDDDISAFQLRAPADSIDQLGDLDAAVVRRRPDVVEPERDPAPPPLDSYLSDIDVISREAWGAEPTECTSTESTKYRMAIHHTASGTDNDGDIASKVHQIQVYGMSGEYCDLPYHFMGGYDGSLYEGREIDFLGGHTSGHNDGNAALAYVGCFHPTSCGDYGSEETDAMIEQGSILVGTVSSHFGFVPDSESVLGHREHDGASTACPGEYVYERLPELRELAQSEWWLVPDFAGASPSPSWGTETVVLEVGQSVGLSVQMVNTGDGTWTSNTKLATYPRDVASPLYDSSWLSDTRLAAVAADTAPGGTGTFSFRVTAVAEGEYVQQLSFVEEWVTWFADDGGPADGVITLRVLVVPPSEEPDTGPTDTDSPATDSGPTETDSGEAPQDTGEESWPVGSSLPPGEQTAWKDTGCSQAPAPWVPWPLLLLWLRRRRNPGS